MRYRYTVHDHFLHGIFLLIFLDISFVLLYYVINTIIQGGIAVTWEFTPDRPIYAQLIEQIKVQIVSGGYIPGEKLPSVRELAADASVNPNTMQKALAELEQAGLLYTQRTSGRFITEDTDMIKVAKDALAVEQIRDFLKKMRLLGYNEKDLLILMESTMKEGN